MKIIKTGMNRRIQLAFFVAACALSGNVPAQSPERLMVAPGPPDIRATAIDVAFFERGRDGWIKADAPKIGGLLAMRCSYEYGAGGDTKPWSLGFQDGETELARSVGTGLLDPATRRTARTWYGRIVAPGTAQLACVADIDNELAESDESNNRVMRALSIPAAERAAASPPASAAPRSRFGAVTPREAAKARNSSPPFDLKFVETAGIVRAADPGALRALSSVSTAAVGETIAVNCSYRIHMDAPNGETVRIASWQLSIERDGQPLRIMAGQHDLVSVRGATMAVNVIERWTPTAAGAYRFRCLLDSENAIAETDETNNIAEFAVEIGAGLARTQPPAKLGPEARGQPMLAFAAPKIDTPAPVMGGTESTVYKDKLTVPLKWQSPQAAAFEWRWQVSLWPFPGDPSVPPPALLREGSVAKDMHNIFSIDLGSFPPLGLSAKAGQAGPPGNATAAKPPAAPAEPGSQARAVKPPAAGSKKPGTGLLPPTGGAATNLTKVSPSQAGAGTAGVADAPIDFHIRIVPMKADKPAGAPSNVVVAHYQPGPDPHDVMASEAITAESEKKQKLAEMNEQSTVYKLEILALEPPTLPSRYGCIIVLKNPHAGKLGHPLANYVPGPDAEYCPKKDPDTHQKSAGEQVLEGLEGYAHAWNGLSWFYDKAKEAVASFIAEVIVPCTLLKELDEGAVSTCQEIAKEVAGTAISVGLMAAGVPPTIPDLEGMGKLAKGEAVEAAVNYTCDLIESEGGVCTPEMRAGLAEAYSKGIDQLQKDLIKQSQEPHCGNVEEASAHGLLPLPCFNNYPGTEVKPAPGTVETSPAVKLRITRTKPDPKFTTHCGVFASLVVKNDIPGYGKTEASLWPPAKAPMPPLYGVGASQVVTLNFGPRQAWHPSGKQGATAEWYELVGGGTGILNVVGSGTAQAQPPLPAGTVSVTCAAEPGPKTIAIPPSFASKSPPPWPIN